MLAKPSVQSITLEPGFFAAIHTDTSSAGPVVGRNVSHRIYNIQNVPSAVAPFSSS